MKVSRLKLDNWRNHASFEFEFNGITVLVGSNASGKTNFLEAIYYLACGKSFRTKDENLVAWDKDFSRLLADVEKDDGKEDLLVVLEKRERVVKTVKIKGQKKASSHLLGHLNCVLFTPEEIDLISTLPEARRRYLNLTISQTNRQYAYNLIHYKRAMEQRNSLLRRINDGLAKENELEVWDGKLAEFGSEIMNEREKFIDFINEKITEHYGELSGDEKDLKICYLPSVEKGQGWGGMLTKLTTNRSRDIAAKITTSGPHRDDFQFFLNGKNVNEFASRGEFRTIILALKLSEIDYLEEISKEKPVLLLDDVFSELDAKRRDYLSQLFLKQQTIETTTDLDHVSKNVIEKAKILELG
jgi:DNA replication and repair protein RecF